MPLQHTRQVLTGSTDVQTILIINVEEGARFLSQRPQITDMVSEHVGNSGPLPFCNSTISPLSQ